MEVKFCTILSQRPSGSAYSLRFFADKAEVWYSEMLLPLALCPCVLYYTLGGAMLNSSVVGGVQMTHDMALRPGPLFMASHVNKGLLPWVSHTAVTPLTKVFSTHIMPKRHEKENYTL